MTSPTPDLIKISELAAEYRVNPDTVLRWVRRGLKIDGEVVRLDGIRIGARWFVTRQAASTWWRKLNHSAEVVRVDKAIRSRSHQQALAELKSKWGLCPNQELAKAKRGRIGPHKGITPV